MSIERQKENPWRHGDAAQVETQRQMLAIAEDKYQDEFRRILGDNTRLQYEFSISPETGYISPTEKPDAGTFKLVQCAMVAGADSPEVTREALVKITPDQVREAARRLSEKFPRIKFEFSEDRNKANPTFSYVAIMEHQPSKWEQ